MDNECVRLRLKSGREVVCNRVNVDFECDFKKTTLTAYVICRDEGVGVYPFILKSLFDMRAQVKKDLAKTEDQIKIAE